MDPEVRALMEMMGASVWQATEALAAAGGDANYAAMLLLEMPR